VIKKLILDRFGKFKGAEFDFGDVTLFHGPNEAGKTTVFDSLAFVLCGSKKNLPGLDRYGEDCSVRAEMDSGAPEFFPHTEFFSMYAVRSDAMSMPKGDGKWLDRIKNGFFSGGIDPEIMARDLDKALNATRRKAEEAARKDELSRAEERLARAMGDLEEVKAARERAKGAGTALDGARARTAALAEKRDALARTTEAMAARTRLNEARRTLARLERLRALSSAVLMRDESAAARALKEAAEEARRKASAAEAAERLSAAGAEDARARRAAEEEACAAAERPARAAREIADRLEGRASPREVRERRAGTASVIGLIASAAAGLVAALALWASGIGIALSAAAFASGAAAGAVLFLALRKTVSRMDDADAKSAWEEARAEWARRVHGVEPPAASGPREFLSRLRAVEAEAEQRQAFLAEARSAERRVEEERARARSEAEAARSGAARAESETSSWLRERGASGYEDYLARLANAKAREAERASLGDELRAEADKAGAEGLDELQARLRQEAEAIEKAWPEDAGRRGASGMAEVQRLREAEAALEAAREEERTLAARWERETALAEKDMRGILLELARAEESVAGAKEAVEADALRRSGESIARDLFRGMARSSDAAFSGLSEAVASFYAPVAGGEGGCRLGSLDEADALVRDGGGTERPPSRLSQGTRDLFYLACRLALARSIGREEAVLVFDEAFKNLDRDRTSRALSMIEDFRKRSGWKIVFFTKDEWLAEAVSAGFPRSGFKRYDL